MQQNSSAPKLIYFDSAATSYLRPKQVADDLLYALHHFGSPGRGAHPAALEAGRCLFDTRQKVAQFFGAKTENTVFTSGVTESLNMVIEGLFDEGDHVITTAIEHNAVLRPLYHKQSQGLELSIIPLTDNGLLDYDAFEDEIKENTKAIICNHVSNVLGTRTDLAYLASLCEKHNLLLIVDGAQSAGFLPVNIEKDRIDVFCFTGHKSLYGITGTGGFCFRDGVNIPSLKRGGSGQDSFSKDMPENSPNRLEAGTSNSHGIAALRAGISFIEEVGLDNIHKKKEALTKQFLEAIKQINGIRIYSNHDKAIGNLVALNLGRLSSGTLADWLAQDYNICVRPGSHCAPLVHEHFGTEKQGMARFSFSYFNTEEEVATAITALQKIAEELKD